MEPLSLGWEPLLISWLNTLPPLLDDFHKVTIGQMFRRFGKPLLFFIRRGGVRVL